MNTYKQTLENKLEKCLTLNEEISNIIEEDKDYDSEGDIAMEAELKIREYLENLKNRWKIRQFNQVKVPKFEIKPFSGNPVEWKTFNESFTAAVDKNISISNIEKMGYLMGFLKDNALTAIKGLLVTDKNYDVALKMLEEWSGDSQLLIHKHMAALVSLDSISSIFDLKKIEKSFW